MQDFEVDEEAPEYLALHPVAPTTKNQILLDEHFETLAEEDEQSISGSDASSEDDHDDTNTKFKKNSQGPR